MKDINSLWLEIVAPNLDSPYPWAINNTKLKNLFQSLRNASRWLQ